MESKYSVDVLTSWRAIYVLHVLRLCLYGVCSIQIAVTAYVTLTIDMRQDENPEVRLFWYMRWILITCWCNVLILIYSPVSFYCEWRYQKDGIGVKHVQTLNYYRDLLMTGILFPATMYTDTMFWLLWHKDPALIADARIFEYLPNWAQHSLHTVSMVFVLLDVLLVPRQRPTSMKLGLTLMTAFFLTYNTTISVTNVLGYPAYAFLRHIKWSDLTLLAIMSYLIFIIFYTLQWMLIDYKWKNHFINTKTK